MDSINILFEIADSDNKFCLEKVISQLLSDITALLHVYANNSIEEKTCSSKIDTACLCLQLCYNDGKEVNLVNDSNFKMLYGMILKHYFGENHFTSTMINSISNLIAQCLNMWNKSCVEIEFCTEMFSRYFTDYARVISSSETDDNQLKCDELMVKAKILFSFANKFPSSLVIDLLNKITEIVISHAHHSYILKWLSLIELLLMKIKCDTNHLIDETLSRCFSLLMDLIYSVFDSLESFDHTRFAKYFDCFRHGQMAERVATGIYVLELIFSSLLSRDSCKIKEYSYILHSGQVWLMLLVGSYHHQTVVRKKVTKVVLYVVSFIKQTEISCSITWTETFNFAMSQQKFDDQIILLNSNNLEQSLLMLENYVQICELLEENQMHVVIPATTKIKLFFQVNLHADEANPLWILPIFLRMFYHEHKSVQKQGLILLLDSQFSSFLMKLPLWHWFISYGVMEVLSQDFIYNIDNIEFLSENENVSSKLNEFFASCHKSCVFSAEFFQGFLISICDRTWSPISLLYVCEAIYQLPSTKAWRSEEYHHLRKIFVEITETHNVSLRITIQKKLISCLMKHCNIEEFNFFDGLALISECIKSKSLKCNSPLWKELSIWILQSILVMKHDVATSDCLSSLLKYLLEKCLNSAVPSNIEHIAICLSFIITVLKQSGSEAQGLEAASAMMNSIVSVTDKAATHVYMAKTKIESVYRFVETLFELENDAFSYPCSRKYFDGFLSASVRIVEGITEHVKSKLFSSDGISEAKLYLSANEELVEFLCRSGDSLQRKRVLGLNRSMVYSLMIQALGDSPKFSSTGDSHSVIRIMTFHWCLKQAQEYDIDLDPQLASKCSDSLMTLQLTWIKSPTQSPEMQSNLSLFHEYNWLCVPFLISFFTPRPNFDLCRILDTFCDQLDVVPYNNLVKLFEVAAPIMSQVDDEASSDLCGLCVNKMVRMTFEQSHSSIFRPLYHGMVQAIFQPAVFKAKPGSRLHAALKAAFAEIITNSRLKLHLLGEVLSQCIDFWIPERYVGYFTRDEQYPTFIVKFDVAKLAQASKVESIYLASTCDHLDFFLHCLTYIPPTTKDVKSLEQVAKHSGLVDVDLHVGHEVSLLASYFLLRLNISCPDEVNFINLVLDRLFEMDRAITEAKPRYHFASTTHLKKQKIWQNITLLIMIVRTDKSLSVALKLIGLLAEDMQNSVRHLMEWSLVLLLYRFPAHERILVEKLKSNVSAGSSYSAICSYMTVLLLCGLTRSHGETTRVREQRSFFIELLKLALPWCTSQHFTIRLYAHAVMLRIRQHFAASGDAAQINDICPWLESCLDFADNSSGNVKKNWEKICQHFMLFKIDPCSDFTIETVFVIIPRLCHLDSPATELESTFKANVWLPMHSVVDTLSNAQPSDWTAVGGKAKASRRPDVLSPEEVGGNLQKKLVVDKKDADSKSDGVVLVASLLSKTSNLGGLSRTCEVFGVKRLVVASLNCTSDPTYQSLSVTAHKWLPMEEVKPHRLGDYLACLKRQGYTIVGTEQTEKSQNLDQFKFPSKSAIVLGNEKEGIPPSLLGCLDVCVEIPQVGLIRSLNVHVSGAIVLWEYHRQHLNR